MNAKEYIESLPERVRPEAIENHFTTFHFDLSGPNGGQFTVTVEDGKMKVEQGLLGEARCVIITEDTILMQVIEKQLNPLMALMTGKVKITNQGEMLKYAKIFGIM